MDINQNLILMFRIVFQQFLEFWFLVKHYILVNQYIRNTVQRRRINDYLINSQKNFNVNSTTNYFLIHFKNPLGATVIISLFSISLSIINRLFDLRKNLTAVFGLSPFPHGRFW